MTTDPRPDAADQPWPPTATTGAAPVTADLPTVYPLPTFDDRLAAVERAKLDARAATAEAERDDALDDLREARADRDRLRVELSRLQAGLAKRTSQPTSANPVDAALGAYDQMRRQRDEARDQITELNHRLTRADVIMRLIRGSVESIDRLLAGYDTVTPPLADIRQRLSVLIEAAADVDGAAPAMPGLLDARAALWGATAAAEPRNSPPEGDGEDGLAPEAHRAAQRDEWDAPALTEQAEG